MKERALSFVLSASLILMYIPHVLLTLTARLSGFGEENPIWAALDPVGATIVSTSVMVLVATGFHLIPKIRDSKFFPLRFILLVFLVMMFGKDLNTYLGGLSRTNLSG